MSSRFRSVALRILVAVVVFASALGKAAADVKWWKPDDWTTWGLLVVPAVVVVVAAIADAVRVYRLPDLEHERKQLSLVMRTLALTTAKEGGVPERFVGVNVYLRTRFRGRLVRRARERFNPYPQSTIVRWTIRKGIIGRTVTTSRSYAVDVARDCPALAAAVTEADFDALPETDRQGFTWDDWQQLRGKYQALFAAPLLSADGRRVIGVLSVDLPADPNIGGHGALFDDAAITAAGESAAAAVAALLNRG